MDFADILQICLGFVFVQSQTQRSRLGNQTGGRVAFFLHTDSFDADYARMKVAGVVFIDAPRIQEYGKVIVFVDLYGNKWDFIGAN